MVNLSSLPPAWNGAYHNLTEFGCTRSSALLPSRIRHADRNLINRFPSNTGHLTSRPRHRVRQGWPAHAIDTSPLPKRPPSSREPRCSPHSACCEGGPGNLRLRAGAAARSSVSHDFGPADRVSGAAPPSVDCVRLSISRFGRLYECTRRRTPGAYIMAQWTSAK